MKLEELYAKYDEIVGKMNVNPIDHFIFDLTDENSQRSLKESFPGIESILMPESGKYLVVAPIVENQDCLVLMFPQQTDGNLGLWVYNTKTKGRADISGAQKATLDNFADDFARMEEITKKFNEFVFMGQNGEISPTEVKDIGSFDISNDEPVEINNTTTDNEENEMTFKPIQNESLDSELKDTKWVEIPNTNAHGVTVTEDDAAPDPFADDAGDAAGGDAVAADGTGDAAPATTDTDAAAAPAEEVPAEGDAAPAEEAPAEEAPADTGAETIDDPKAKMRELLAYYTNYMNELVQDPNTSTDLISATQEMIDSLIKNMESADGIEEVKADAEEAAKEEVSAEEAPPDEAPAEEAPAEEAPVEGGDAAPAEGETAPAEEPVAETTQENPITDIPIQEDKQENPITDIPIQEDVDEEQKAIDDKIDAEVDDLHKDDWEDIQPATSDNILTPGDIQNSVVNDVDISNMVPSPEEELATTTPDETVPAPTSDVLDDTALPTPDEEDALFDDGANDFSVGADGLPLDTFDGDLDNLGLATPASKKIQWSSDYATNGVATTDDNNVVVPGVLTELQDYYKKVADEVSKVPGKEDVAMKLQKIQILSQTIQTEWNNIASQIGDVSANTFDRSIMGDLEKDELDQAPAMDQVGADVLADQEEEEEDDLKINSDIEAFCESFKHLL